MFVKRTLSTAVAIAAVIAALANLAGAQSNQPHTGWSPIHSRSDLVGLRRAINDNCAASIKGNNLWSPVVGSWFVTVTISGRQFVDLPTLNFGGTVIERSGSPGNLESAGHGVWVSTGPDSVAGTFEVFEFDEQGALLGRNRIRSSSHLDHQGRLISGGEVDFIDTDDNVYCTVATFTGTGTRILALAP